MSKFSPQAPNWDTSSFGHPAEISPLQRSALGDHLAHCCAQRDRPRALRIGVGRLHGLLAERVITSALLITLLVGASLLAL